jgi:integrase
LRAELRAESLHKLTGPRGVHAPIVWDADRSSPPGFGVRVTGRDAETKRTFVVAYRTTSGVKRLMRLGLVGVVSLSDARKRARKILDRVAAGEDPVADARESREGLTVGELVSRYVEAAKRGDHNPKRGKLSAKTLGDYGRMARRIAGSQFGKRGASGISDQDVTRYTSSIDGAAMANRLHALLSASFGWALRQKLVRSDPTAILTPPRSEEKEKRRLSDSELEAVLLNLDATDKDGSRLLPLVFAVAVRLLLLLGVRLGQLTRMRWSELKGGTWETRGKGDRDMAIPLPRQAVKLIASLGHEQSDDFLQHEGFISPPPGAVYVLAGRRGAPLDGNPDKWWSKVREVTGVDFSAHACRRTFSRGIARLLAAGGGGVQSEMVSRLLAHKTPAGTLAVTEGYHEFDYLSERREALQRWADRLEAIEAEARLVAAAGTHEPEEEEGPEQDPDAGRDEP